MISIKLTEKVKNNKQFIKDVTLNTLAFGLYIITQQVLLLPIYAKIFDAVSYANIIVYITVINVVCNVFGGQLGVVRQLRDKDYVSKNDLDDFTVLLLGTSLFIALGLSSVFFVLGYQWISVIYLVFVTLATNYRFYIRCIYRLKGKYYRIIIQNVLYMLGVIFGLLLLKWQKSAWLPLLFGECLALLYTLFTVWNKPLNIRQSQNIRGTLSSYLGLVSASALTNAIVMVDKLLVYPFLGAYSLAVYNAGSTVAKVSALLINPLNDVIIIRLSNAKAGGTKQLMLKVINYSIVLCIVIFIITIPIIYLMTIILYHQYLHDIIPIVISLSLSCSIGIVTSIMKSFILNYAKTNQLSVCYAINLGILIICGWIGASQYGLSGFAFAMVFVRFELWISFILVLLGCTKKLVRI